MPKHSQFNGISTEILLSLFIKFRRLNTSSRLSDHVEAGLHPEFLEMGFRCIKVGLIC